MNHSAVSEVIVWYVPKSTGVDPFVAACFLRASSGYLQLHLHKLSCAQHEISSYWIVYTMCAECDWKINACQPSMAIVSMLGHIQHSVNTIALDEWSMSVKSPRNVLLYEEEADGKTKVYCDEISVQRLQHLTTS